MKKENPRISVIIICYNQEEIISRAINSVICQKDYLYELIISDDCSTDGTWNVIRGYLNKYPDKIKAYRQEHNLGVYENLHSTYDKVTGDIVFFLSGDDEFGCELFKKTCETVISADVDFSKDKYCVITDFKAIYPDGKEVIRNENNLVEKHNPFSLKFRGLVYGRGRGESYEIFKERKNVIIKRKKGSIISSSLQEGFTDNFPFYATDAVYYIPYIGNIYYAGIGISTKFKKNRKEYLEGLIEYCNNIPNYFHKLNKYDLNWLQFQKIKSQFLLTPNIINYFKYVWMFIYLCRDPLSKFFLFREFKSIVKSFLLLFMKNRK